MMLNLIQFNLVQSNWYLLFTFSIAFIAYVSVDFPHKALYKIVDINIQQLKTVFLVFQV